MKPNKQQKKLIERTEGFVLADAGAGTGKTFSITERYIKLLEEVEPENIFLATFTRNAADEMGDRIAEKTSYSFAEIKNAPISTFHSHCQKILERHGFETPRHLGINEEIEGLNTVESRIREEQQFEEFYQDFKSQNPEYREFYAVAESDELLELLKSLASKGVIPEESGWYLNSESYLDGDYQTFEKLFKELNRPQKTSNGNRSQSRLKKKLYSYKHGKFEDEAPTYFEIAGGRSSKQVRRDFCRKSFQEERGELKSFVRQLYFDYLNHCLENGYLNFSFMMALAFVTLYENSEARKTEKFDYIMIDEFQDTNEIQLKISMLLASKPNICVVGDWKQSIYSFQYADIDNIKFFHSRVNTIIDELNSDEEKVGFRPESIEEVNLKKNYRSGQEILEASEQAFTLKGSRYEQVSKPDITSLESETDNSGSVERLLCENEIENILAEIQSLEGYDYSDIAVISRRREFGLELREKASEYGVPVEFDGRIELFNSEEGKLLLAWLRALEGLKAGWAVILEREGYNLGEAEKILEDGDLPAEIQDFRDEIAELELEGQIRRIFELYGFENARTQKILEIVLETYRSSYMTRPELARFIKRNIDEGETYEIDYNPGENSVTVQTIHSAKGLEYPVVFVAGINQGVFPSYDRGGGAVQYDDILGLRQKKVFRPDKGYTFDNWKYKIASACTGGKYDEERRLMYVAMTRAQEKLFLTAEEGRESRFYEGLDIEVKRSEASPHKVEEENSSGSRLRVDTDISPRRRISTVVERSGLEDVQGTTVKGDRLHRFMRKYVEEGVEPETEEEEKLAEFISGLKGSVEVEKEFLIPGEAVVKGRADMVVETENRVKIIDVKTGENDCSRQLEEYREAFKELYPGKEIEAEFFRV